MFAWTLGFVLFAGQFLLWKKHDIVDTVTDGTLVVSSAIPLGEHPTLDVKEPAAVIPVSSQRPHPTSSPVSDILSYVAATQEPKAEAEGDWPAHAIHVCFSTDDHDLRPLAAAMNSTITAAREPKRLVFHVVTSEDLASKMRVALQSQLLKLRLEMHHDQVLEQRMRDVLPKKISTNRAVLTTPFNLAAFYLPEFLAKGQGGKYPSRAIYLDTDVLLLGDIGQLHDMDLHGKVVAAVKECSQTFSEYINIDVLRSQGFTKFDGSRCIFNRGIFLADLKLWKQMRIAEEIEGWMRRQHKSDPPLYHSGVSQPPWLLALDGRYAHLSADWNCVGAGRHLMKQSEAKEYRKLGFDQKVLKGIGAKTLPGGKFQPFPLTCSAQAKMLHFNGRLKPWSQSSWQQDKQYKATLCQLPPSLPPPSDAKTVKLGTFVKCSWIWWLHMSVSASSALQLSKD